MSKMKKIIYILIFFISLNNLSQPSTNLIFRYKGVNDWSDSSIVDSISGQKYYLYNFQGDQTQGYISAKSKTAVIINNDTIYLTCAFPNFNYADSLYFKLDTHSLNSDTTENLPYRLTELSYYSIPLTGSDSISAKNYFNVPTINADWVVDKSGSGDFTTIDDAIASSLAGDTTIIKSGIYIENNATRKNMRVNQEVVLICIGDVRIKPSTGATSTVKVEGNGQNSVMSGFIFDGAELTFNVWSDDENITYNNCLFQNTGGYAIYAVGRSGLSVNNCAFDDTISQSVITAANFSAQENYFYGQCLNCIYPLTGSGIFNFSYNDLNIDATQYLYFLSSDGTINIKYENISVMSNALDNIVRGLTAITTDFNFHKNSITCDYAITNHLIQFVSGAISDIDIYKNTFSLTNQGVSGGILRTDGQISPSFTYNTCIGTSSVDYDWIRIQASISAGTPVVSYNYIDSKNESGYVINIGTEVTGAGDNTMEPIIEWNSIRNALYYDTSLAISTHGIFVGFNKNAIVQYNRVHGAALGVALKGSTGTEYTSGGVYYNLLINNCENIRLKGVKGVEIYNNTCYSDLYQDCKLVRLTENSGSDPSGGVLRNNLVFSKRGSGTKYLLDIIDGSSEFLDSDNNLLYNENKSIYVFLESSELSFSAYQDSGYDVNSFKSYPNFKDTASYELWGVYKSHMINNGVDLGSSYDFGIGTLTDWQTKFDTINQKSLWDIGCYSGLYQKILILSDGSIATDPSNNKIIITE